MPEIFLVSGMRSAIGTLGGGLKDVAPTDLATRVATAAIARSGVEASQVGLVVFGQVIPTEPIDSYISRVVAVRSGIPIESPAMSVNRLCGSGLQAIVSAFQALMLGDAEIALAGGVESMSRAPYLAPAVRFGARMGDSVLLDTMVGALTDPFDKIHMGITAENVAKRYGITREMQDDTAYESHRRAANAIQHGYFKDQIVPIETRSRGKTVVFDTDEHVRHDSVRADFDKLRPAFQKEAGSVTAGNASGINDASASVILATGEAVRRLGLKPMARLVSYGHAGVEPTHMGIGPVPASRLALKRAGIAAADLSVIESNEAFAAQACAVSRELDLDPARVNPNGSGISLGHPIGATGAINTLKLAEEMQRTGGRYGLVTMCIGGGQGIAAILERV